jgi:hypothetical protein
MHPQTYCLHSQPEHVHRAKDDGCSAKAVSLLADDDRLDPLSDALPDAKAMIAGAVCPLNLDVLGRTEIERVGVGLTPVAVEGILDSVPIDLLRSKC